MRWGAPVLLAALMLLPLAGGAPVSAGEPDGGWFVVEEVVPADFPVAMAFASDGRLFFTERDGRIRLVRQGDVLQEQPFATVTTTTFIEFGFLGIALHPDFESNGYVYAFNTAPRQGGAQPEIYRWRDHGGIGEDRVTLDWPMPVNTDGRHVGGNLHFGPDGMLYVTVGEYHQEDPAQDLSVPIGKIQRLTPGGAAAPGNPFEDDPEADPRNFAYGLRNSFDFTFHPVTGDLWATENGPSRCDELNLVVAGGNYGWPQEVAGTCEHPDINAKHYFARQGRNPAQSGSTIAPTGVMAYSGKGYAPWTGDLFVCDYLERRLRRLDLDETYQEVLSEQVVLQGCALDITEAPDGSIFFGTFDSIRRIRFLEDGAGMEGWQLVYALGERPLSDAGADLAGAEAVYCWDQEDGWSRYLAGAPAYVQSDTVVSEFQACWAKFAA